MKTKKFDRVLRSGDNGKTFALVCEDDYNETLQAELTGRLVDDFGTVEMIGYGTIKFGGIEIKVAAVYFFDKKEFDSLEKLGQLTYTVSRFNILDDQD